MVNHNKDAKMLFRIWTEKNSQKMAIGVIVMIGLISLLSVWGYFLIFKK